MAFCCVVHGAPLIMSERHQTQRHDSSQGGVLCLLNTVSTQIAIQPALQEVLYAAASLASCSLDALGLLLELLRCLAAGDNLRCWEGCQLRLLAAQPVCQLGERLPCHDKHQGLRAHHAAAHLQVSKPAQQLHAGSWLPIWSAEQPTSRLCMPGTDQPAQLLAICSQALPGGKMSSEHRSCSVGLEGAPVELSMQLPGLS